MPHSDIFDDYINGNPVWKEKQNIIEKYLCERDTLKGLSHEEADELFETLNWYNKTIACLVQDLYGYTCLDWDFEKLKVIEKEEN